MKLTYGQIRIALLQMYYNDKPIYNMSFDINVEGNLDIKIFENSLNYIFKRFKILKINILLNNEGIISSKMNNNYLKVKISDIGDKNEIDKISNNFINEVFDLENDLLVKVLYFSKINKLIFLFSDLIIDGQTVLNFFKDLSKIYNSLYNLKSGLLEIPNFEKIKKNNEIIYDENILNFWKKLIIKKDLFLKLPVKNINTDIFENRYLFLIESNLLLNIKEKLKKYKITLFDFFVCIFLFELHLLSNNEFICIDTLMSGDITNNVGLFNNIVLIPFNFTKDNMNKTLEEFIQNFSNTLKQIKTNKIELEYLCNNLDLNSLPNIRIHFEYSNKNTMKTVKFGDSYLSSDIIENSSNTIRQNIIFNICDFGDKIECYFSFNKENYDLSFFENFKNIFINLLNNTNKKLNDLRDKYNFNTKNYNILSNNFDKRFYTYKMSGKYPNISFNNYKKNMDKYLKIN